MTFIFFRRIGSYKYDGRFPKVTKPISHETMPIVRQEPEGPRAEQESR